MKLSENLARIGDAIKERRFMRKTINQISDIQDSDREEETMINSSINELMNFFAAISEQSKQTNIELEGMIIEPKRVNSKQAGTVNDPRLLIESAKKNDKFNKLFTISETKNRAGEEQYIIKVRRMY